MPPVPTAASITLDQQNPSYGDILTFTTSVPKLTGNEYPMIALVGFQDVNEDGTVDDDVQSADIVFSLLQEPGTLFPTSPDTTPASSSIWSDRIAEGYPIAAEFRADLLAISWKGGKESVRTLATTGEFLIDS